MIKLLLKIVSPLLLLALAVIAFIKLLPWCLTMMRSKENTRLAPRSGQYPHLYACFI
jgi:hypothetical protein